MVIKEVQADEAVLSKRQYQDGKIILFCKIYQSLITTVVQIYCVFFPFLLTSPLSLLKLFTVTVGCLLHHIVLGLNVSSVRSFTQMEGLFRCIFFLKLPCLWLLYLLKEMKKTKPTNQSTNKRQSNTQTCTLLSMNRTWLENFKEHFFSSKIDIHGVS